MIDIDKIMELAGTIEQRADRYGVGQSEAPMKAIRAAVEQIVTALAQSDAYLNAAMERAERAEAECEQLREDAERGRFMLKHGEWRRNSEYRTAHIAVAVPFDSDLSCYATRETAIDAAMQEKQP